MSAQKSRPDESMSSRRGDRVNMTEVKPGQRRVSSRSREDESKANSTSTLVVKRG